jgi:hypothetical protein
MNNIPYREGYKTIIHKCKECIYALNRGKAYEKCEAQIYKKQGYCYTYKKL